MFFIKTHGNTNKRYFKSRNSKNRTIIGDGPEHELVVGKRKKSERDESTDPIFSQSVYSSHTKDFPDLHNGIVCK